MRFIDRLRERAGVDGGDEAASVAGDATDDTVNPAAGDDADSGVTCACTLAFERAARGDPLIGSTVLRVDADDCHGGDLARDQTCRAAVIGALADRDATRVRVRSSGLDRWYDGRAAALLLAAGRFVDAVAFHDPDLAERARADPLAVAREAVGRAGPVARIVAETGLAACADSVAGYDTALTAGLAPTVALGRTDPTLPTGATLRDATDLPTGGTAARYDCGDSLPRYHLRPRERTLSPEALSVLTDAYEALATGEVAPGDRAAARAVRSVAAARRDDRDVETGALPVEALAAILHRHTTGLGVLDELFADPRVTDAFLSPPAVATPVRVVADGETLTTNVALSAEDIAVLSTRVRAESGRAFSRASPTANATLDGVRVAAVTDPASDGPGFAFRRRDDDPWTLPRLVAVGSIPPWVAGLLSVAVERGAAILVAGPRGAGKTSLLGALCFEVPPSTRTVVVEDTPELPIGALSDGGRDVQGLRVGTDADAVFSPTEAVRTALRLGEGALVVGEVRGEEASALYEAMRVGAAADAVLGTIHGTGGESVRERVVSDLGVPASSFATTDLVVTLAPDRRVDSVEEVHGPTEGDFVSLAARDGPRARRTGLLDRGESRLCAALTAPEESYAEVRAAIDDRAEAIRDLADAGRTDATGVDGGRSE